MEKLINFVGKNIDRIVRLENGEHARLVGIEKYGDTFNYLLLPLEFSDNANIAKLTDDEYIRKPSYGHIYFTTNNEFKEDLYAKNGSPKKKKIVLIETPYLDHNEYLIKLGEKYKGKIIKIEDKIGKLENINLDEKEDICLTLKGLDGLLYYFYEPILPFYLYKKDIKAINVIKHE